MSKKGIMTLVKTVLPLGLGIYLFWLFFSSMTPEHIESFKKALREANYFWIFVSLLLAFIALLARAQRWKYMLEPMDYKTPFWNRYHAMMIGYLINFTIPRAGEPSRSAMLYRSDGVPFSKSFGTIIAERAVDLIMLGLVTLLAMSIGYDDLMTIFNSIAGMSDGNSDDSSLKFYIYGAIGFIALAGLSLFVFHTTFRSKLIAFIRDVLRGVFSIFKTEHPWAFIFYTFVIWVSYVLMFVMPFYCLQETVDFPWSGLLIGFVAGSVGITLTNGGIGVYPLLVGMVVALYLKEDYPTEADGIGKAIGMIAWISQTILMVVLGLISLVLLPKNYTKENDPSRLPSE